MKQVILGDQWTMEPPCGGMELIGSKPEHRVPIALPALPRVPLELYAGSNLIQ
jgi:hypothetical protein